MSGRFSRQNLLKDLRWRADGIAKLHGFTRDNGYAQLGEPPVERGALDAWKMRFLTYGQWVELLWLAEWIEDGDFGTGERDAQE